MWSAATGSQSGSSTALQKALMQHCFDRPCAPLVDEGAGVASGAADGGVGGVLPERLQRAAAALRPNVYLRRWRRKDVKKGSCAPRHRRRNG